MTNSAASPRSERATPSEIACVAAGLGLLALLAASWCFRNGYVLYYGDAQAHLSISRSVIDSRTPGYDQLGTVWLPLLHVLCLPFVGKDFLWCTGLAGTIPVALCFVWAGVFFYLTARQVYGSALAAAVVAGCFALNPNMLYLASIPMTELVFFAGLATLMFALFRFRETQNRYLVLLAVCSSWWMSLTRYDGWFLIPFAGFGFAVFARRRRSSTGVGFAAFAVLAPTYWIAHNWWETSNALDFFNGPYSASAIQGSHWYPGFHDWWLAVRYYFEAGHLCAGSCLLLLGIGGVFCAAKKKVLAPILFLLLTPLFYVWSIHSSRTPIHVPGLWPFSYYNTRYGIALAAVAAFATGALALALQQRWGKLVLLLPLISGASWLLHPSKTNWICWKESQVNSVSRRAWTREGVLLLAQHYQEGSGVIASAGDVTGIFCRSLIPLRETLNIGNGPAWFAGTTRPDLVHRELWAVAQSGDALSRAMKQRGSPYKIVEEIQVKGAPNLEIYERQVK